MISTSIEVYNTVSDDNLSTIDKAQSITTNLAIGLVGGKAINRVAKSKWFGKATGWVNNKASAVVAKAKSAASAGVNKTKSVASAVTAKASSVASRIKDEFKRSNRGTGSDGNTSSEVENSVFDTRFETRPHFRVATQQNAIVRATDEQNVVKN